MPLVFIQETGNGQALEVPPKISLFSHPRENPMTIGYAAGAYDLFHVGHLNILRQAKANCDHLIAGVVHDDVLEQTKGRRPVIPIEERAEIVSHISYVDEVHIETNPDKLHTWSQKPFDVFFKGDDWKGTEKGIALENRFAEVGVRVHYFPYTEHTSSTKLRKVVDLLEAEHDAIEALGRIMRLLDDEQQHGTSIKRGLIAQEND
jgi:hypothetical protein